VKPLPFKLLSLTLWTMFFLTSIAGQSPRKPETYAGRQVINSIHVAKDFSPDGDLTKGVWRQAKPVIFDSSAKRGNRYPGSATRVGSLWTASHVYFSYACQFETLNYYEGETTEKERWELWNRDVVEVFINPQPERFQHYYEFEVSPNNQWIDLEIDLEKTPFNDAHWDSHFEHATRINKQSRVWTCEMRIPVSSMSVDQINAGTEWRVNFYRADGPGDDTKRRFMSWSPLPGHDLTFHQPASFGVIRFVKPGAQSQ